MRNPVLALLNLAVHGLLRLELGGAGELLRVVVFRPLSYLPLAAGFVGGSRDLALLAVGGVVALAGVRALWPALTGYHAPEAMGGLLVRAVVAAGLMGLLPTGIRFLFQVNNLIVGVFAANAGAPVGLFGPGLLSSSPLWLLAVLLVLVVLVVYLSLLYVTRLIHIIWLGGLIPWFLLWWLMSGDDGRISLQVRELVALSLTQAVQAVAWWLALRNLTFSSSLSGLLLATGSLWFMVMVPHEFRHLLGLGTVTRPRLVLW